MNRRKKLYLNMGMSLALQLVTFICGFILPKQFLLHYGSQVNGMIASISRFLSVITFLELGIGPVIQSNLYQPLADRDNAAMSRIVKSAEKFYHKIAYIFLAYIGVLFFAFPQIDRSFDFWFTASLLLIISISTFAQYYFGITYQVFLNADQKVYVNSALQIVTVILNTVLALLLMALGCSVHVVKLVSAAVFVIRPIGLNLYVRKHYRLDRKITYTQDPIKQKWNGFAQHLAYVVCQEIDVVVLTFLASYQTVSVYSVYYLVTNGITMLIINMMTGLESYWGNILAEKEWSVLEESFRRVETLTHMGVTALYTVTAILITPFIGAYIRGTADAAEYYAPVFGVLLTFAFASQCLRLPYFRLVKAAGHFKQTQNGYFISALINIVASVALVRPFGLSGVALGTLFAMGYNTVYLALYLRKNILNRPFRHFMLHIVVDLAAGGLVFLLTHWLSLPANTYGSWILYALKVSAVGFPVVLGLNAAVYAREFTGLADRFRHSGK